MAKPLSFFKGEMVPISEANVNIMTHALHYGTAVFEGVRGNWNESQSKMFVFRLKEHSTQLLMTFVVGTGIPLSRLCHAKRFARY